MYRLATWGVNSEAGLFKLRPAESKGKLIKRPEPLQLLSKPGKVITADRKMQHFIDILHIATSSRSYTEETYLQRFHKS
jgi:hypothetical protein